MIIRAEIRPSWRAGLELALNQERGEKVYRLSIRSTEFVDQPGFVMEEDWDANGKKYLLPTRTVSKRRQTVEPLLQLISGCSLPISPPYTDGMDGTSFKLQLSESRTKGNWSWWAGVPPRWAPLAEIINQLLALSGLKNWPRCEVYSYE